MKLWLSSQDKSAICWLKCSGEKGQLLLWLTESSVCCWIIGIALQKWGKFIWIVQKKRSKKPTAASFFERKLNSCVIMTPPEILLHLHHLLWERDSEHERRKGTWGLVWDSAELSCNRLFCASFNLNLLKCSLDLCSHSLRSSCVLDLHGSKTFRYYISEKEERTNSNKMFLCYTAFWHYSPLCPVFKDNIKNMLHHHNYNASACSNTWEQFDVVCNYIDQCQIAVSTRRCTLFGLVLIEFNLSKNSDIIGARHLQHHWSTLTAVITLSHEYIL